MSNCYLMLYFTRGVLFCVQGVQKRREPLIQTNTSCNCGIDLKLLVRPICYAVVTRLTAEENLDLLKGTSLEIYRLLLKNGEPLGIREVQRALNLSSPSVAQYHLNKLERAGLLKREKGSYVVNKVLLENFVKISRFLIPKYLFYSIFAVAILIIELTWLRPADFSREYFFSTAATAIFVVIFCYETAKVWLKRSL